MQDSNRSSSYLFRVILIPPAVFFSVIFGGAYGSGREIVEFMTKYGPSGGFISLATIAILYAAILFLCFEFARLTRSFEYRGFFKNLLGRGWVLYELLFMLGLVVALAICASASGAIALNHFGLPEIIGGIGLLLIVVVLNYQGRRFVEISMILCIGTLALAFLYLAAELFSGQFALISDKLAGEQSTNFNAIKGGMTYAFSSGGFIPILLYCAIGLRSRSECLVAALLAASVTVLPGIVLHSAFLTQYPAILDETLPAYTVVQSLTSPGFLNIYLVIVFLMIAQTGVGLLQGFIERIDGWMLEKNGKPMPPIGHALTAGGVVIASMAFASIGLVELIFRGFTFFSAAFFFVFFIPLFTIGIYKIFFASPKEQKAAQ